MASPLLSTIRCQTSWISPSVENVTIPPTKHLGTGQQSKFQSTRKTRGSTLLENPVVCLVEITSSGSNPWLHWIEVDFFQDPLSPLALKQQQAPSLMDDF